MSIICPNTGNMNDCKSKRRCAFGDCEGQSLPSNPRDYCPPGYEFRSSYCDCELVLFGRLVVKYAYRNCLHSIAACDGSFTLGDQRVGDNVSQFILEDFRFYGVATEYKKLNLEYPCSSGGGELVSEFLVSIYAEDIYAEDEESQGVAEYGVLNASGESPTGSFSCRDPLGRPAPGGCSGTSTTWAQVLSVRVTPRGELPVTVYEADVNIDFPCG